LALWIAVAALAGTTGYFRGVADQVPLVSFDDRSPAHANNVFPALAHTDGAYEEEFAQVAALGYMPGYESAAADTGVLHYDPERAQNGYNLFTSGHDQVAYLMTMEGDVLHEWAYSFHDLWPERKQDGRYDTYLRRAHVFDNGDLLAIFETHGIFKIDAAGNLLWERDCGAHHDLFLDDRGHIFVLTREITTVNRNDGKQPIYEEFVVELAPNGDELSRVSIFEAVRNSNYRPLLEERPWLWDMLHTNSLKPLPADGLPDHPAFQPGSFLLSIRELNAVAVLDPQTERIEWALSGMWYRQHEATLVGDGNILLFDNRGYHDRSRVIEFDPITQDIVWQYGLGDGEQLVSLTSAGATRLENGNTLIFESNAGRVLEVTPENDIVWEFVNPHRTGENNELTATILHLTRLPESFTPRWIDTAPDPGRMAHAD